MRMRLENAAVLLAAIVAVRTGGAQSAAEHVALGDRAYAEREVQSALGHYQLAITVTPENYEALWKASRAEVDLAEATGKGRVGDSLMALAERHAQAAIAANPAHAEGHFSLARADGRKALSLGTMDRIKYAKIIRSEAVEALKYDSLHAGALHVLGVWNAEVMRVNGVARTFARTFLGAEVFGLANWNDAQRYLELAVKVDPERAVHRLDLGVIYLDRGDKERARAMLESVAGVPLHDLNDETYKRLAVERLNRLMKS
jgi:tetratricopeptide (TPR) repeat protein